MSLFTHIYLERQARPYPLTADIIRRFPHATVIEVDHYKEVFNRPAQDWRVQKRSQKLILAKRTEQFLYPGSQNCPRLPGRDFFYNTLVMNCLYDCAYCYLQGLYPTANMVVFVNIEDYLAATEQMLKKNGPAYIPISYDTDLLAIEDVLGYCKRWATFAAERNDLWIEIRTKSAATRLLHELTPSPQIILAWTLSPQGVVEAFESRAPSLDARLRAIGEAQKRGWRVRICIDPVLLVDNWEVQYRELIEEVRETLDASLILDLSVGFFRMNTQHLRQIRRQRTEPPLLFTAFKQSEETSSYSLAARKEAEMKVRALLDWFPTERISFVG